MLPTTDWINTNLHKELGLTDTRKVTTISTKAIGDGYAASTYRIELKYNNKTSNSVDSVVIKTPIEDSSILETARINGIYEREIEFYRVMQGASVDVKIPHCYYANYDHESGDFLLILEDLNSWTPGNHHTSRSLPEITDVFKSYGRMHQAFLMLPELRQSIFLAKPGNGRFIHRQMQQLLDPMVTKLRKYMGERTRERILLQLTHFEKLYEYSKQAQDATLTHGDAHQANIMFAGNGADHVIIDWQLARFGLGMEDVTRFLLLSTEPEFRRDHADELIGAYATELGAAGSSVTLADCRANYVPMLSLHACMSLLVIGVADFTQSEEQRATGEKLCRRLVTVIDELESQATKLSIWT